jgi:hypothetical protein
MEQHYLLKQAEEVSLSFTTIAYFLHKEFVCQMQTFQQAIYYFVPYLGII